VIAILLLLISCTAELKVEDTTSKVENPITWSTCSQNLDDHPCNFTLLDQNGSSWSLYDHYGSIIVLDFSTEWCGYCNVSGSTIQALQDEYTNLDVIFVTLLIEDNYGNPATKELCASWADRHGITAPVLAGSRELISDDPAVGWQVTGWPRYYFINSDMRLVGMQSGYSDSMLKLKIEELLGDTGI